MRRPSKTLIALAFYFICCLSTSIPIRASVNETGVSLCTSAFFNCTRSLLSANFTEAAFRTCTLPFGMCMGQFAFLMHNKSVDCYLAESAWTNLYISVGFATGVFLFSNIMWPMILKGSAKWITELSKSDPDESPWHSWLGKKLLYVTDTDGDGKVTGPELITPQTIFAFASVSLPVYQWFLANDAQARCDYQNSLPPHY